MVSRPVFHRKLGETSLARIFQKKLVGGGHQPCYKSCVPLIKQAMMTLQGVADHRFTSVSLSTNVFHGEIIFFPLNIKK